MNSIERFYATIERRKTDRPAMWLGVPDIKSEQALFNHYNVESIHELKVAIGDDFYAVDVPYVSESANAIYAAFDWSQSGNVNSHDRTLTEKGCFTADMSIEDVEKFNWPDPSRYIDPAECKRKVDEAPEDKVVLGLMWSSHFQDVCAAFGMEEAFMNMITDPELIEAVNDKIVDFYLKANKIFYEATKGKLHAVLIGNDMGSQRNLMLSPEFIRKFVIPSAKKLIEQAHNYGLKVLYHSCGAIQEIIPDLIDAGVDAIHPIQALANGMDAATLKEKFENQISFCGGVDTQELLVNGSIEDVENKVKELMKLFPTGLIISPSHEAILPDIPPENIMALFDTVKKGEIVLTGVNNNE